MIFVARQPPQMRLTSAQLAAFHVAGIAAGALALFADQPRDAHAEPLAERVERHAAVLHHVMQRGRGQHLRIIRHRGGNRNHLHRMDDVGDFAPLARGAVVRLLPAKITA